MIFFFFFFFNWTVTSVCVINRFFKCGLLPWSICSPWWHGTYRPLWTWRGGAGPRLWDVHHRQCIGHSSSSRDHHFFSQHHSQKVNCIFVWERIPACLVCMYLMVSLPLLPGTKAVRASTSQPEAASSLQLASRSPNSLSTTPRLTPHKNRSSDLTYLQRAVGFATIIYGPVKCGRTKPNLYFPVVLETVRNCLSSTRVLQWTPWRRPMKSGNRVYIFYRFMYHYRWDTEDHNQRLTPELYLCFLFRLVLRSLSE